MSKCRLYIFASLPPLIPPLIKIDISSVDQHPRVEIRQCKAFVSFIFIRKKIKVITTGIILFQDGTDSIICKSLVNGTALVGHYPIKGYQTPVRTMKVNYIIFCARIYTVIIEVYFYHFELN